MTWREWLCPVVTVNLRQFARIRRQAFIIADQDQIIENLRTRLRRIQDDVDLIAACLPAERRALALSLVRDRHRIDALDTYEEADGG